MNRVLDQSAQDRFLEASSLLPVWLRCAVRTLPPQRRQEAEEFRLRAGQPPSIVYSDGEERVPGCMARAITAKDLMTALEVASQGSVHTILERLKNGYVTVSGGHRLGICGSGVVKDGKLLNVRQISSLAVRIAKQVPDAASGILEQLLKDGVLQSTLIISPPGCGKTTLLRELIRRISDGEGVPPMRVGVADERGELAAMEGGVPRMSIGACTDVMDSCPKEAGLMFLLRGMNPQVLATDEITHPEDLEALKTAAGCGVALLATAHGGGVRELRLRPLYRTLLAEGIFQKAVVIAKSDKQRQYRVEGLEGGLC